MAQTKDKPWKEAITEVLKAAGKATHYADIAKEIQKRGLRTKVGATPASTVNVLIHESIKKDGATSPFIKVAEGEFMLRAAVANAGKALNTATGAAAEAAEAAETGGIIKAFGMFWRRDWIDWTTNPGLRGRQQEGADCVDFADQHGVYLLHDGREVIYVGRTTEKRLATRLSEHTRDRLNGRWDRFSWFGLLSVTNDGKLAQRTPPTISSEDIIITLEAILIEGLEPRQNRKRGDAFRAVEYLQAQDPELLKKAKKKLAEEMFSKL